MTNSVIRQLSSAPAPFGLEVLRVSHPPTGISPPEPALLPDDVLALIHEGLAEGHTFLSRLQAEWANEAGPYASPGAMLVVGRADKQAAGIAGVVRDPYLDDPATGRLRHVYVGNSYRRRGVADALVRFCIESARLTFGRLRLRTANPGAAVLYERHGFAFDPAEPDATHVLAFPRES
jgi:GNAT superfamily N-acetyltransferase